jgi:protein-disulfide isomerase
MILLPTYPCRRPVQSTAAYRSVLTLACLLLLSTQGSALAQGGPRAQGIENSAAILERAAASRAKGHEAAPVLVYEIADFQCPYCAQFSRTVFPRIDSAYVRTGKVQWVFVNLPLPSHHFAWGAAEAALCAGGVAGKFWDFEQRLFANQHEWVDAEDPTSVFLRYARDADIPIDPFRICMLADLMAPIILEDVLFAAVARVNGTPTFLIQPDQKVVGLKNFEEWQMLLDAALRRERPNR